MSEQQVSRYKAVYFTYTIRDASGAIVERVDIPVGYVHGADSPLIEKVEQALEGHTTGDRVEVTLSPEEGFGAHRPELTYTDDIENVPPQFRHIGAEVEMKNDRGEVRKFVVTTISDGKLTVDGNHPLAGQTVVFTVEIADIRQATPDEIANGIDVPGVEQYLH